MMEYKGYIGHAEFDDDAGIFHGDVVGIRDVVTFQGESVAELRLAFRESVDEYLAYCARRGESPDKPFSGRLNVRVDPTLHRRAALAAKLAGKSVNAWITALIDEKTAALG
jgi:predicted HicB family RNase H-like nuclease